MRIPISMIEPEGSEPLYEEPNSGLRLTAQDYAVRNGFENAEAVKIAYQEAQNDIRTTESNYD